MSVTKISGNVGMQVGGTSVSDSNPLPTGFSDVLSYDIDSIDVARQSKDRVLVPLSAIAATTTSQEIDCSGFNSVLVEATITGTGTWKVDVLGTLESGVTPFQWTDASNALMTTGNLTATANRVFKGIPDYIKVLATEVADGATLTVKVQPLNL